MGAKGSQLITSVLIPAAFPYMISGFKQGWAFAWRGVIGAVNYYLHIWDWDFYSMLEESLTDVSQVICNNACDYGNWSLD